MAYSVGTSRPCSILLMALFLPITLPSCATATPINTTSTRVVEERLNPFSNSWDNSIVICTILRNEYLADVREWLQYHRYIGVDHVLLHDNNEDGGMLAQGVSDFMDDGYLSVIQVDGEARQLPVYDHCAQKSARKWAWMIAMDVDEFIHVSDPMAQKSDQPLKTVLRTYRYQPGIFVQWRVFGPGPHESRPGPGGPLRYYTQCVPVYHMNRLGKTIANTFWLESGSSAHAFFFRDNGFMTNDNGQVLMPIYSDAKRQITNVAIQLPGTDDAVYGQKLIMHHYMTRSRADFEVKMQRGGGARARNITFRSVGWFEDMRLQLQKPDPVCAPLAAIVEDCCFRNNVPYPPVPDALPTPPVTTILYGSNLRSAEMDSNNAVRTPFLLSKRVMSHDNPFSRAWPSTITVCVLLNHSIVEPIIREWALHHRQLGVGKFVFYAHTNPAKSSNVSSQLLTLKPKLHALLGAQYVEVRRVSTAAGEDPRTVMRQQCIDTYQQSASWLAFMELEEYLFVRGGLKGYANSLRVLLHDTDFRLSSGVVMPVYNLEREDSRTMPASSTPLKWYDHCWRSSHVHTRTIVNSEWILAADPDHLNHYLYRGQKLPVTDTKLQWLEAAKFWAFPNVTHPLLWYVDRVTPDGVKPHPPGTPFGSSLSLFRVPSSGDPKMRDLDPLEDAAFRDINIEAASEAETADVCAEALESFADMKRYSRLPPFPLRSF